MAPGLAEIVGAWPFAVSLAAAAAARTIWAGRRRMALNEALHELRRPLQALALAAPRTSPERLGASVEMASAALERLDREINGVALAPRHEVVAARPLAEAAVARWRSRAALSGGSLELRWWAAEALVQGDRREIAQALDNLLLNAIEHGGGRVELRATLDVGWLRLTVVDSGGRVAGGQRRGGLAGLGARLSGRERHGHGLRVVRRTATAHGGRFTLRSAPEGSTAVLELPLLNGEAR